MTTTRIEKNSAARFCNTIRARVVQRVLRHNCETTFVYELQCRDLTFEEAQGLAAKINAAGEINKSHWALVDKWECELSPMVAEAMAEAQAEGGGW